VPNDGAYRGKTHRIRRAERGRYRLRPSTAAPGRILGLTIGMTYHRCIIRAMLQRANEFAMRRHT
jgi:hypothetical protein